MYLYRGAGQTGLIVFNSKMPTLFIAGVHLAAGAGGVAYGAGNGSAAPGGSGNSKPLMVIEISA